jgi:hypothetical protein
MTTQTQRPIPKLVEKLKACDFKIETIDPPWHGSIICKLQQSVFFNELGFPKEVAEQPNGYENISTCFIARVGNTPVGKLRLVNPQLVNPQISHNSATLPIEAFLDIKPMTKGQAAIEISNFMLLQDYRRRSFCLAMMACCLSYAEQNNIAYTFALTVSNNNKIFEKVGFQAFAKPFFNAHYQVQTTPRAIDLKTGQKIIADLTRHLQEAKIIP